MKTNHERDFEGTRQRYKGGATFSKRGVLSGKGFTAVADFDFSNGNRGMAQSVAGAKKYVNSRFRHHENAATRDLAREPDSEPQD